MKKISSISTEGVNYKKVNKSLQNQKCRTISKFELELINSSILYLSNLLEITNEILILKTRPSILLLFQNLMIKLLLELTTLTEEEIGILLDINKNTVLERKNYKLPILITNTGFSRKYSKLLREITSNECLLDGNWETHHNIILTKRIRTFLGKVTI